MLKKLSTLLFVIVIAVVSPFIAAYFTNIFNVIISEIDPNNYFLWISMHHIIQALIGIILLKIVFRKRLTNLGFNLDNREIGFRILKLFFIIWTVIIISFFIFSTLFLKGFGLYITELYPLNRNRIISKFAIELLCIIALGEEPIYRAFVSLELERHWDIDIVSGKIRIPVIYVISAVLFMLSHINFDLIPLKIIYIDPVKLFLNLVFGFFLAYLFDKTRSIFYTTLAHVYSNVLIYTLGYITTYLTLS